LYRDFSLHLEVVGDRLSVHDESGDVMVYYANFINTISIWGLLEHHDADQNITKLKIVDRLEMIQHFKYCCNGKRYQDAKKQAMFHAVNAVPCVLHLHKKVWSK
jgi:hypothetical protein